MSLMPLNLADILEAYFKVYVTFEKAKTCALKANVSAESETLLQEVENIANVLFLDNLWPKYEPFYQVSNFPEAIYYTL